MLAEEIRSIKSSRKDLRNFGLTVGGVLLLLGVVMVWSASGGLAARQGETGAAFAMDHAKRLMVGIPLLLLGMAVDVRWLVEKATVFHLGVLALLALLLVPGFPLSAGEIRGATRWLDLPGFRFQPSELAKLTLILYLAGAVVRKRERGFPLLKGTVDGEARGPFPPDES